MSKLLWPFRKVGRLGSALQMRRPLRASVRLLVRLRRAKRRVLQKPVAGGRFPAPWRVLLLVSLPLLVMAFVASRPPWVAGLALAAGTLLAVITRKTAAPRDAKELDRFEVLSDRLERGIEKLKDLQWELSDNESRYRDLLDSQADIITRTDTQGRLTFVNRSFCRTFGVEPGTVLGTPFTPEVLQREGEPRHPPEPGRRQRFEELVLTAEGPRWFAFEQHSISGQDGLVREMQLLGRDVTEQRRIQSALSKARDQAEAANRAKSRFLAAMSHEIRTPMNGILGMTSLLAETNLSAEQRSYVDAVDHSAKNLLTIIDEILDLSKIEAGKLEIHPAPFVLDECLQSVVELLSPRAHEKRLDFAWRLEPDLPRIAIGDETRVRQILLNLVGNAIKFTDSGGVAVRVRGCGLTEPFAPEENRSDAARRFGLEIEVQDTGAGIAVDQLQNLFAEFEQADDAVRRKRLGTGLGLAISRRLARAMEGDITVSTTLGHGSKFVANIVLLAQPAAPPVLPAPVDLKTRLVLLVSDRPHQRALMQETLLSLGIPSEIATVGTAHDIMARARRGGMAFDTVVADVEEGPDNIGRLIGWAHASNQKPPRTILVVDHPVGTRLEPFRAIGCDAYLVRPVRPTSLLTQLEHGGARPAALSRDVERVSRSASGPKPVSPRGSRILIVEDNEINALLARRMSEKAGCTVHHASSGPAALAWCEDLLTGHETVDLVLMDIHMPEMDGFEASRRMKRLFAARGQAAPPIVALTANAFAEDRKRCLENGLDDYLAKPFDRSELEALLERWCAHNPSPRDGSLGGYAA